MAKKSSSSSNVMKRDTSKAGQVVNVGGMSVTYDKDGYVKSAKNDKGAAAAKYASSSRGSTSSGRTGTTGVSAGTSAAKPVSGGSSGGTTTLQGSNVKYTSAPAAKTPSTSTKGGFHKEAQDAAARGDWDAVARALANRQAKIDADGYGDRGTSNKQIFDQLQAQYGSSFDSLSSGMQDYVKLNAGIKLPYSTSYGTTGEVYKDKGWQAGVNYLDEAQALAKAGDLEGAYDALMRRGFKLADGGSPSNGGGTSQDQAYAMVHQLYNQSPTAREQYLNNVETNRQRLQDHQTQFGLETRPELANRRFVSTDGRYVIYYDETGAPSYAMPVSSKVGKNSYVKRSPEETALRAAYYNGDENTDFAELQRQIHNLDVVRTGVGRLIDQNGNFASGTPIQPVSARDWTGLPQTDRYQDRAALQAILDQINAGTDYAGGSAQVPIDERAQYLASLPTGSGYGGGYGGSGGRYGGGYGGGYGVDYDVPDDFSSYLRQVYEGNFNAQMARLQSAYEQNMAQYRAHDDLIAEGYRERQNQAAAQNDLQRMLMLEMGSLQGLNTGATGQLALAQSAAMQNTLAGLMAAENQDRAENDLQMRNLAAAYQGDMASAAAQIDSQLASALYSEMIRKAQAAEAARQAAQQQANWERQFAYQQQQDAMNWQFQQAQWDYNTQAAARDNAYSLASTMLKNGILPDSATLASAGISQSDAAAYVQAVQQAAIQGARKSTKSSSAGNGGGGTQDYSGLFNAAYGSGTPSSFISNNYKKYGFTSSSGLKDEYESWAGDSGRLSNAIQNVNTALTKGNVEAAHGYVRSIWNSLSGREKEQLQGVLDKYGIQYTP